MTIDVYERLAKHVDNLPAGYPRSESGVEMRILRRIFSPEEAELALHLTLIPEEPRVIAHRAQKPIEEVVQRLEQMDKKGQVISYQAGGETLQYQAAQYIAGFWEGQVNNLDRQLAEDFEEYLPTYLDYDVLQKAPQLRTIPVGESIDPETEVMSYENAYEFVRKQESIAVANCICRQERKLIGEGCDKLEETCMAFGDAADHGVRTGRTRAITTEEALTIIRQSEEVGLVLQPANSKDPLALCMCCGCCCMVFRRMKLHPHPASVVSTPFMAALDPDNCTGCGTCETRCQMDAIYVDNGTATLDLKRCIGCGLCVSTCPSESISIVRKPESEQPFVPKDEAETYIKLGQARGKLGIAELIGMQAKSTWDRLIAPK
ncbi:MAG: 4Fe-4S binding protein [Chloroflexota bacterium]